MAANSPRPVRQARIDRIKDLLDDLVPDRLEPLAGGQPTTVIYMTGGTVTIADPDRPPVMIPEPA